jgi:hypothetical protein
LEGCGGCPETLAMASANPLGGLLCDYGSDEEDDEQQPDGQLPLMTGIKRYTARSKLAHSRAQERLTYTAPSAGDAVETVSWTTLR